MGAHRATPRRRVPRTVLVVPAVGAVVLLAGASAAQAFLGGGQPQRGSAAPPAPPVTVHGTVQTEQFWIDVDQPDGARPPRCPAVRVQVSDASETMHATTTSRVERRVVRPDPADFAVRRVACRLSYEVRLPRSDGYVVTLPGLVDGADATVIPEQQVVRRTGDMADAGSMSVILGRS